MSTIYFLSLCLIYKSTKYFLPQLYIFFKKWLILSICHYLIRKSKILALQKLRISYKIILQLIKCTSHFVKCVAKICSLIWNTSQLNFLNKYLLIKLISILNHWPRFSNNLKPLILAHYGHRKIKIFRVKKQTKKP